MIGAPGHDLLEPALQGAHPTAGNWGRERQVLRTET